jgi:hypothetical protein
MEMDMLWQIGHGGFLGALPVHLRSPETHHNSVWSHFPSRQVKPLGLKMLRASVDSAA